MAKKKKINPLLVIVIIVVFIMVARERGFLGVAHFPTGVLIITDLEDIQFSGLTVTNYGFTSAVNINIYKTGFGSSLGFIWIDQDTYVGGFEVTTPIVIYITVLKVSNMDIRAGDYITLTYDGGQTLDVYLPASSTNVLLVYPSTTGETYYDEALTQDACTNANGCIGVFTEETPLVKFRTSDLSYDSGSTIAVNTACDGGDLITYPNGGAIGYASSSSVLCGSGWTGTNTLLIDELPFSGGGLGNPTFTCNAPPSLYRRNNEQYIVCCPRPTDSSISRMYDITNPIGTESAISSVPSNEILCSTPPADECTSGICCDTSTNTFRLSSYECLVAVGTCDIAEFCTGSSDTCPTNIFETAGTSCGTDMECDGSGSCIQVQTCTTLRTQLGTSITGWIAGGSRAVLGTAINNWVNC